MSLRVQNNKHFKCENVEEKVFIHTRVPFQVTGFEIGAKSPEGKISKVLEKPIVSTPWGGSVRTVSSYSCKT